MTISEEKLKQLLGAALAQIKSYKHENQKLTTENRALNLQIKHLKDELEKR